jgi:Golgi phosphoprotein 3 (GPP34)
VRLGDLSLAESLFFLGHDPFTGKARIRQDILEIGLAGAVLGDLLFDERITLDHGTVVLTSRYATGDGLADRTLALIMAETAQHGVRDWAEHLRDDIATRVAQHLAERELLTPKENRGMFRRTVQYLPADLRTASAPRARIRTAMLGRSDTVLPTATLALLAWSTGLDDICEPELTRKQMADWITNVTERLAQPAKGLIEGVDAAIAATVYGGNRG